MCLLWRTNWSFKIFLRRSSGLKTSTWTHDDVRRHNCCINSTKTFVPVIQTEWRILWGRTEFRYYIHAPEAADVRISGSLCNCDIRNACHTTPHTHTTQHIQHTETPHTDTPHTYHTHHTLQTQTHTRHTHTTHTPHTPQITPHTHSTALHCCCLRNPWYLQPHGNTRYNDNKIQTVVTSTGFESAVVLN